MAMYVDENWKAKEDIFYLQQGKQRALIRVEQRREKPIDALILLIYDLRIADPLKVVDSCAIEIIGELLSDVSKYKQLEDGFNLKYWNAITIVLKDLMKLKSKNGITLDVVNEIEGLFSGKSVDQLLVLQNDIEEKLASNSVLDYDYWQGTLESLLVCKSRQELKEIYKQLIRKREEKDSIKKLVPKSKDIYIHEPFEISMEPTTISELPAFCKAMTEEENQKYITEFRARLKVDREKFGTKKVFDKAISKRADDFIRDAFTGFSYDERVYCSPLLLDSTGYQLKGKYQPRKPLFICRIQSGYVWSKENRAKYTYRNPPPKITSGYRFTLFYPDLVESFNTPTFSLEDDDIQNEKTQKIVFRAGAPYQDIAFRITKDVWDMENASMTQVSVYKSRFINNILQLWFRFVKEEIDE